MLCPRRASGCRATDRHPRHQHPAPDINAADVRCPHCQGLNWWLRFGGPLPTLLDCGDCGASLNLSTAVARIARSVPIGHR